MILVGLAALLLAALGWLATTVVVSFTARPRVTENLTGVWTQNSPTALGRATAVEVPADQTLVALLVGTELRGIAGTTTGACTATASRQPLPLAWPVHRDWRVDDRLKGEQQAVATADWTNPGDSTVIATVTCDTRNSTADYFLAVPSQTAVIARDPRFQPWAWVALGGVGLSLVTAGVWRARRGSAA